MLKKKWVRVLLIIIGVCLFLFLLAGLINYCCNLNLRKYINSFDEVSYQSDRLKPSYEDGYVTFTTDEDFRVMHITDVHIGGGFWTYKTDKKTIYELITMLQAEKPDLVILGGDNTYAIPGIGWNGGFTLNNKMVAKTVISVFEHEKVYFSTVFGNHDTEAFDFYGRESIGKTYMDDKYEYSLFESQFIDRDAETVPSVSNQFILLKNTEGKITKLLLLLDTNAYVDTTIISTALGKYDTIHEAQVSWAEDKIKELSKKNGLPDGDVLKSLVFVHIPMGEYRTALDELITETENADKSRTYTVNGSPENTEFVEGFWGEEKVCFGGISNTDITPDNQDNLFEVISEKLGSAEAYFCGHDHVNNAVVYYKGVMLSYGFSLDNTAYGKEIQHYGIQRGATLITISKDGSFTQQHKNAYTDYGCRTDLFTDVYLDKQLYPHYFRTVK